MGPPYAVIGLLALSLVRSIPCQGKTVRIPFKDPERRVTVLLPKSCNPKIQVRPKHEKDGRGRTTLDPAVFSRKHEILHCTLDFEEGDRQASISITLQPSSNYRATSILAERLKAVQPRKGRFVSGIVRHASIKTDPQPYILAKGITTNYNGVRYSRTHRWIKVCRRVRCWTVEMTLQCKSVDLDEALPEFFHAWDSMRFNLVRHPWKLKGFKVNRVGTIEIHSHRSVPAEEIRGVIKIVRNCERTFSKFHDKIERPKDEPLQVVLHQNREEKKDAKAKHPWSSADYDRRIHTDVASLKSRYSNNLARDLSEMFLRERYGRIAPRWVEDGEGFVGEMKSKAGRKAPAMTRAMRRRYSTVITATLSEISDLSFSRQTGHAQMYTVFFHFGPSKYKAAYKAFLADLEKTGDGAAAAIKHLYSLDQVKLKKACSSFVLNRIILLKDD